MRRTPPAGDDRATNAVLARAREAPVRAAILDLIAQEKRVPSPDEIVSELQVSPSSARYHLRVLDQLGLARLPDDSAGPPS